MREFVIILYLLATVAEVSGFSIGVIDLKRKKERLDKFMKLDSTPLLYFNVDPQLHARTVSDVGVERSIRTVKESINQQTNAILSLYSHLRAKQLVWATVLILTGALIGGLANLLAVLALDG